MREEGKGTFLDVLLIEHKTYRLLEAFKGLLSRPIWDFYRRKLNGIKILIFIVEILIFNLFNKVKGLDLLYTVY